MLERSRQRECRPFTRRDRSRLLKKDRDERGVASTVGTIMALLVFLTFLALFTNSYVPVWMLDNERTHMNEVFDQFGDLKGKADNMVVMASTTGSTSLNMYAPITLGANGIPIFAAATAGQLTYVPFSQQNASLEVKFSYYLDSLHPNQRIDYIGGGMVQLYCSNRYYVEQWVCYENGAILVKQRDGQLVSAIPSLSATKSGAYTNVSFTQFDYIGKNATVSGTGVTGLNLDLIYLDQQTYTNHTSAGARNALHFSITLHTQYGHAWYTYLNQTFHDNGLVNNTDYHWTVLGPDYSVLKLDFLTVWQFDYSRATLNMAVQNA
ncbi:MAG: hypothetical protein LUO79_04560 [Methanomassiliicoccales archaeon]|nr:hypothetical protein [Methanomassiliicoccales archaeon]